MQKGRKEIHKNVAYAEGKSMLSLTFQETGEYQRRVAIFNWCPNNR